MKIMISIIIPVYKVESYLDRCVKSVVDQSYSNIEIILVDDGSPDHCPEMCDEWAKKDSRINSSFEVKTVYSPWLRALHRFVCVVNWIILL